MVPLRSLFSQKKNYAFDCELEWLTKKNTHFCIFKKKTFLFPDFFLCHLKQNIVYSNLMLYPLIEITKYVNKSANHNGNKNIRNRKHLKNVKSLKSRRQILCNGNVVACSLTNHSLSQSKGTWSVVCSIQQTKHLTAYTRHAAF